MRLAIHLALVLVLGSQGTLTPNAGAAEIDLLVDGLGLAQCLDPNAGVAGGFTAAVVRNKRVYGPVDEFQGVDLFQHTRGGAFNIDIRLALLRAARSDLSLSRFLELQEQLFEGEFLSRGQQGLVRALTATAERLRQQGKDAQAQELADRAEDLLNAGRFDHPDTTRELQEALAPRDRLLDLLDPNFLTRATVGDSESHFAVGLTDDTEKPRNAPGGLTTETVRLGAVPFLVGPDGIRNTEDDLPFLQEEEGMRRVLQGMPGGPGPGDFASNVLVMVGGTEVELYRSFKNEVILTSGCDALGGTVMADRCETTSGEDITDQAIRLGCRPTAGGINRDEGGACIELAVADIETVRIKFETLEALGDLRFRPSESVLEPFDLTDFRMRALQGGRGLPARPRSALGGLTFPGPAAGSFARRVDPGTGAPVNSTGPLECTHRIDGLGRRVGPNGKFDDDYEDDIPSMGNCLLFDNPEGDAAQPLRASDQIASDHYANQTFFHALCTASFEPINGRCAVRPGPFLGDRQHTRGQVLRGPGYGRSPFHPYRRITLQVFGGWRCHG